ncbi:hypothetical protein [Streptomyces sp. MN13]
MAEIPPHLTETLASMDAHRIPAAFTDLLLPALGESLPGTDVSELTTEELRRAFLSYLPDTGQEVLVAWPADRTTAKLPYRAVLERIDDLWYPSMDDLIIVGSREGRPWAGR